MAAAARDAAWGSAVGGPSRASICGPAASSSLGSSRLSSWSAVQGFRVKKQTRTRWRPHKWRFGKRGGPAAKRGSQPSGTTSSCGDAGNRHDQ